MVNVRNIALYVFQVINTKDTIETNSVALVFSMLTLNKSIITFSIPTSSVLVYNLLLCIVY